MAESLIARDYFFEFAGMPKSGKSTVAEIVAHYYKRLGHRVSQFHGGGRYVPIDKSARGSLNTVVACRTAEYLLTQYEREVSVPRIFLLDRGLFDCCVFTSTLAALGKISRDEEAALRGLLTLPRLTDRIDNVFAFVTSPTLSLEREALHKISPAPGQVMNESTLSVLRASTEDAVVKESAAFPRVTLINTEEANRRITPCARLVIDEIDRIISP